jgi:hypothetical protein
LRRRTPTLSSVPSGLREFSPCRRDSWIFRGPGRARVQSCRISNDSNRLFTTVAQEHNVTEPMVPRTAKFLRAVAAGVAVLVLSFSLLRPAAELFTILIRRHWPEAWFSGSFVWYLDFFAAGLAFAIAIAIGRYSFRVERQTESKPDRVDRLLYLCALAAVSIGVFQWAEGHYLRALAAAITFLFVIPWLGKRWINRSDRRAGIWV